MNISNKTISIAFIVVLIVTVGVSVIGMSLMSRQPMVLQGQVEATEIRISG
ncbi:HlyD family secretion protein, partial [Bacteroides stercoris]